MIRSITWNNHDVLGDLELNFAKQDGSIYNTIILAGENGAGKTTIMDTLSEFLNLGSIEVFSNIRYDIAGTTYRIIPDSLANLGYHKRINEVTNVQKNVHTSKSAHRDQLDNDTFDIRFYGCAYSKARSGFNTEVVKSTSTTQLDDSKYESDDSEDFTAIKQMLVDIKSQDNSTWARLSKNGDTRTYQEFLSTGKMHRFESAFNHFFDDLQFEDVNEESSAEKKILFTKHGKTISIDQMSTGEKQIVFRGSHLLKNSQSIAGGVILIDEPELSMHPKWQGKILTYYRDLFTNNGIQTSQMIFSTHSEYVIRAALQDSENVLVIILEDNNGTIVPSRTNDRVLPTLTASEINYLAFGIASVDYHIALYGRLQLMTQKHRIAECDAYIAGHADYDPAIHAKFDNSPYGNYSTLPTYIRNAIDHPDSGRQCTPEDLHKSIELLRKLCYPYKNAP